MEPSAIASGRILDGTIFGAIAAIAGLTNTRATPCSAANRKRIGRVTSPCIVSQPSPSATVMSIELAMRATVRRSKRSATQPATGVSSASGRNCAAPSSPSTSEAWRIDMP